LIEHRRRHASIITCPVRRPIRKSPKMKSRCQLGMAWQNGPRAFHGSRGLQTAFALAWRLHSGYRQMGRATLSVVVLAALISANAEALAGLAGDFRDRVDLERAQASAAAGDATAMSRLAERYWRGDGVNRDPSKAVALYQEAAALGNDEAMLRLGFMHENGTGLPQSHEQAAAWYRRAVDSTNARAMFRLGVLYWSGRGVPQDLVEAYKWLDLASAHASGPSVAENAAARDSLARVLSTERIAEARKRAQDWLPSNLIPHRHGSRAKLQPTDELQVDTPR
jgi:TPR repeat protein